MITRQAEKKKIPNNRLKSRANSDWNARRPMPGQANTDSTTTEPPRRLPIWTPAMVMTGRTAFRRICLRSEERRVGKECAVRVDIGGRRIIKKKKQRQRKKK